MVAICHIDEPQATARGRTSGVTRNGSSDCIAGPAETLRHAEQRRREKNGHSACVPAKVR